ncbi:MAG: PIN domain-containing protein [Patescibacteria group bacterium]
MYENKLIVADADILISLVYESDINHEIIIDLMQKIIANNYTVQFPNTAILETITALKRALNKPDLSQLINTNYQNDFFGVIYINDKIQKRASIIFNDLISKQNTIFDAIVIATAEIYEAKAIFSMDKVYKKYFPLAQELVN